MATQQPATAQAVDDKNYISHVEANGNDDGFEKLPKSEKVDEFGAHAKTDPKEIALVKKLDWYMMVKLPFL